MQQGQQGPIEGMDWDWRRDGPALAVLALLPLVLLKTTPGGVPPYGGDIVVHVYPLLSLLAHGLHSGRPTLWNFYAAGGYPLAPYGALALYPPVALVLLLLPVSGAITALYALYLAALGLGMYLLAAELGQSRPARLLAAITLMLGGFVAAHIYAGHLFELGAVCPLPLAYLLLRRAILRPGGVAALWCGALIGLMILAAGLQFLPFALAPLPLLALWHSLAGLRAGERPATVAWPLCALALAGVVGLALGAVYLLPFQEILGATLRAQSISLATATAQSLPWGGLTTLVAPNALGNAAASTYWPANRSGPYFHEIYAYAGLLPLLLAPVALRRRAAWPYAVLAALALLVMLGGNTPLYSLLYHLPGGAQLRVPARAGLILDFSLALLAGFGLDALRGSRRYGAWRDTLRLTAPGLALCVLTLAGLLLAAALAGTALPLAARQTALAGAARLAVATVIAALACLALIRSHGRLALVLPALAVIDWLNANGVLIQPFNPAGYFSPTAAVRAIPVSASGYRVLAPDGALPLGLGMVTRRLYDVQDAAPLALSDFWRLCHPSLVRRAHGGVLPTSRDARCDVDPLLLRLFGVSTVWSDTPLHLPGLRQAGAVRSTRWTTPGGTQWNVYPYSATSLVYHYAAALPRVFTVARAQSAGSAGEALRWLQSGRVDPRHVVILSPPPEPYGGVLAALQSAWAGWLAVDADNGLRVSASGAGGYLVIDDGWFPGWTATVDGRATPVLRADYLLRAVRLPPGRHTVRMVYAPLIFLLGMAITLATVALIVALSLAAVGRARRRRRAIAASEQAPAADLIGATQA